MFSLQVFDHHGTTSTDSRQRTTSGLENKVCQREDLGDGFARDTVPRSTRPNPGCRTAEVVLSRATRGPPLQISLSAGAVSVREVLAGLAMLEFAARNLALVSQLGKVVTRPSRSV